MSKYALEVTPATYDLCVFLNEGVDIETPNITFLAIDINGPREITAKVVTEEEMKTETYMHYLLLP